MKKVYCSIILFVLCQMLGGTVCATSYFGEDSRQEKKDRLNELKNLKSTDMVVYGPENPKATVTAFTDLNCGYCRKLHNEIPRLTELGIQIRYLALPRQGVGSPGYNKMVTIWCSADRQVAMSRAMQGESLPPKTCQNAIREQLALARKLGVSGTPTLIFADGTVWPGYLSAEKLAREAIRHGGESKPEKEALEEAKPEKTGHEEVLDH